MDSYFTEKMQPYPYKGNPNKQNVNYPSGLMGQFPLLPPRNIPSVAEAAARVNAQAARIIAEIQADRRIQHDNFPVLPILPSIRLQAATAQLPPAAAAPPKEQKTLTTAVTADQLRDLRHHYHQSWDRNASDHDRRIERERVAELVGVTPRIVIVKYGELHRQGKKAAERARNARAKTCKRCKNTQG